MGTGEGFQGFQQPVVRLADTPPQGRQSFRADLEVGQDVLLVEQDNQTCETAAEEDEVGEREEEPDEGLVTVTVLVGCGDVNLGIVGWLGW